MSNLRFAGRGICCGLAVLCLALASLGCGSVGEVSDPGETALVVADTTFMADIVQNVVGERQTVAALLPPDTDPHSFEPTPQDARKLMESRAVVINVVGLIPQLDDLIAGVGDGITVIEAASGLPGVLDDPHVWLDPVLVMTYVENIAGGLASLDPEGTDDYRTNGRVYSERLRELDEWISDQVSSIPPDRRLLVTNHESLSYFARRYGFTVVGTVFPSVSGEGAPSAQQLAALVREIERTGAPAIFLETGSNTDLAAQVGRETGAEVVTDLYLATLGENAPTYVDMMRWNVGLIVEALR